MQDEEWLADRLIKTGAMRDSTAGERVGAELWPERFRDLQVPQPNPPSAVPLPRAERDR